MRVVPKIRELSVLAAISATLWLVLPVSAQTPGTGSQEEVFKLGRKYQKDSSLEALEAFERQAPPTYTFGEGDQIAVEVFAHPELTGKHTIGPDGDITLPVAGDVHLADLSREEGRKLVEATFGKYYSGLSIVLRTEVYGSNRIFMLGRVAQPGVLHFDTPPTLLEAITRAGSLPVGGIGADKAAMDRCVIFRDRTTVVWVDLKQLLKEGNLAYDIQLKRNDIIYMPDSDDQTVYVLGEVLRPGAYHLRPDTTFMQAYAEAGGVTKDGVADQVQLVRPTKNAQRTIAISQILQPDPGLNFVLADGDIIYVPKRGLAKFGYIMQQFAPAAAIALVGKGIAP